MATRTPSIATEWEDFYRNLGNPRYFEEVSAKVSALRPLSKAKVTSFDVFRGHGQAHGPYIFLVFDLRLEDKGRDAILRLLGPAPPNSPDLSCRVKRKFVESSRGDGGGQWRQRLEFVRDPKSRVRSTSVCIMTGCVPKLRLYHLMDFMRIFANHEQNISSPKRRPSEERFTFSFTRMLHSFATEWHIRSSTAPTDCPHVNVPVDEFAHRWCQGDVTEAIGLHRRVVNWRAPGRLRLCSKPKVDGPLFHFEKSPQCILTILRHSTVRQYTIGEFCHHILRGVEHPEAYAKIMSLEKFEYQDGFRHRFVVLEAHLPSHEETFFIRIDRAADAALRQKTRSVLSPSTYLADDTVRVSFRRESLLEDSTKIRRCFFQPFGSRKASVRELAKILDVFRQEFATYALLGENCWYLASLIHKMLLFYSTRADLPRTFSLLKSFAKVKNKYKSMMSVSSVDDSSRRPTFQAFPGPIPQIRVNGAVDEVAVTFRHTPASSRTPSIASSASHTSIQGKLRQVFDIFRKPFSHWSKDHSSESLLSVPHIPFTEEPESYDSDSSEPSDQQSGPSMLKSCPRRKHHYLEDVEVHAVTKTLPTFANILHPDKIKSRRTFIDAALRTEVNLHQRLEPAPKAFTVLPAQSAGSKSLPSLLLSAQEY